MYGWKAASGQRPVRGVGQELLAVRPGPAERLRPRDLKDVTARVGIEMLAADVYRLRQTIRTAIPQMMHMQADVETGDPRREVDGDSDPMGPS